MRKDRISFMQVAALLATGPVWGAWPAAAASVAPSEQDKPGIRDPGAPIPGQLSTLFKIDDDDPESSIPSATARDGNPIEFGYFLQDLAAKSEAASKRNDQRAYIRYLRALSIAVPGQAQGWSMLCEAYEKANDRQRAIRACKYAIDREGVALKDFARFVHVVVTKEGDLDADEKTALREVLAHLDKDPDLVVPTAHVRCESAVKMKDEAAMEACTAVLAKAAPNDPKTIVFQWSLAMMRGRRDDARNLVDRAKTAGLAMEATERMNNLMAQTRWWPARLVGFAAFGIVAVVLAFLLVRRRLETRRLAGGAPRASV